MTPIAIPAADLQLPVLKAAANAAAQVGHGEARLAGYNETSGMIEYDVKRRDGTRQNVCVHLVLECFVGNPS